MTPWLVLGGTVLGWATLDALRKRLATRVRPIPLAVALGAGTLPLFFVWAVVDGLVWPDARYWLWTAGASIGNVTGAVLLLAALRVAPISIVVPLMALSPVFSAVLGLGLLEESPTLPQWGGMAAIVGGAAVLALTGEGRANLRGIVMGAGVALGFAVTVVLDKGALQYVGVAQHGAMTGIVLSGSLAAWLALRGRLGELLELRHDAGWVLGASLTLAAALALQLVALQLWLVSVVEGSKRAFGLSAAALVGRLFFGETLHVGKLVAIALMVAGVIGLAS